MKNIISYEVAMILLYFGTFFTGIGLSYLLMRTIPDARIIVVGILTYLLVPRCMSRVIKIYYGVEEEES